MREQVKAYATRNPTATVAGVTGTIVAGIVAIAGRFGIEVQGDEVALLVLVVSWVPVAFRAWLDHRNA